MARGDRTRQGSAAPESGSTLHGGTPRVDPIEEGSDSGNQGRAGTGAEEQLQEAERERLRAAAFAEAERAFDQKLALRMQELETRMEARAALARAPEPRRHTEVPRSAAEQIKKIPMFEGRSEEELRSFLFLLDAALQTGTEWFDDPVHGSVRKLQTAQSLIHAEENGILQRWINEVESHGGIEGMTYESFKGFCKQEVQGDAKKDMALRREFYVLNQHPGQSFKDFAQKLRQAVTNSDIDVRQKEGRFMEAL